MFSLDILNLGVLNLDILNLDTVFPRKLFLFDFNLMYCDLWLQYIQVRKLSKGGNYLRAETIRGNTVFTFCCLDGANTIKTDLYIPNWPVCKSVI